MQTFTQSANCNGGLAADGAVSSAARAMPAVVSSTTVATLKSRDGFMTRFLFGLSFFRDVTYS
jgi:hypothetical protein